VIINMSQNRFIYNLQQLWKWS